MNAEKHRILNRRKSNDEAGWGFLKLMTALALLPENLIEEGFVLITKTIFDIEKSDDHLKTFVNYYSKVWLRGFKPSLFSVYKKHDRTNNASERHNRQLKETLKEHSTIIMFLSMYNDNTNTISFKNYNFYINTIFICEGYLTEYQRHIRGFLIHTNFWRRLENNTSKRRETQINDIWSEIEEEGNNVDLLLILYKLANFIGKAKGIHILPSILLVLLLYGLCFSFLLSCSSPLFFS